MLDDGSVRLAPIRGDDLPEVGAFLHGNLNARLSARAWADAIVPTWPVSSPNHGFLLRADDRVVGVQLAFYSEREIDGRVEDFCNLGAWCVLEEHRSHGLRLLRAALAQRRYHFTDLSPSGSVVPINQRLRFESLDTTTALVPHVGLPLSRDTKVVARLSEVERLLAGDELRIFYDHLTAAATTHLVLVRGDEHCYVVLRRDRRKGLPVFASLLYVGNPGLLRERLPVLGRHLLVRHRLLATLVEVRLLGGRPRASYLLSSPRPKMFRSSRLPAPAFDNLYSELALVAW